MMDSEYEAMVQPTAPHGLLDPGKVLQGLGRTESARPLKLLAHEKITLTCRIEVDSVCRRQIKFKGVGIFGAIPLNRLTSLQKQRHAQ